MSFPFFLDRRVRDNLNVSPVRFELTLSESEQIGYKCASLVDFVVVRCFCKFYPFVGVPRPASSNHSVASYLSFATALPFMLRRPFCCISIAFRLRHNKGENHLRNHFA